LDRGRCATRRAGGFLRIGCRPVHAIIFSMPTREANVELLFLAVCPHATAAFSCTERAIRGSGIPAQIVFRVITDPDEARRERFLGSPSIRVRGSDIEPGAERP
jgi:hypothetical protein